MARINLHIEAEDAADLKETLRRLAGEVEITGTSWVAQDIEIGVLDKAQSVGKGVEANPTPAHTPSADASQVTGQSSAPTSTQEAIEQAGTGPTATNAASPSEELDAHGHPWSADLHASTKGKTQDGLWRMGRGKERPAPADGYPKTDVTETAPVQAAETPVQVFDADTGTFEEADEFAAFTAAAREGEPVSTEVPARTWSDADLSKLCNQAAQKMGSPAEIKKMISDFVPAGVVDHSRNIPVEDRETFAQAIEAKAGIVYEG